MLRSLAFSFSFVIIALLVGCSKENNNSPSSNTRTKNPFGLPVASEACRLKKFVYKGTYTETGEAYFFEYNSDGLVAKLKDTSVDKTLNFFYNTDQQLVKVTDVSGYYPNDVDEWHFQYSDNRLTAFNHLLPDGDVDTFKVTYNSSSSILISYRDPYRDSAFIDSISLNGDYNPVSITRYKFKNGAANRLVLFQLTYGYKTDILNPYTPEFAVFNWLYSVYGDFRYFVSLPNDYNFRFDNYPGGIIPFGNKMLESQGMVLFSTNFTTNNNGYPTSYDYRDDWSSHFSFEYDCQ